MLASMSDTSPLHDTDFLAWTRLQAEALRAVAQAGTNIPLDWELLAEEIEGLGKQLQFELENRLDTIIEHLLKLQFSPARHAYAGWRRTIRRSRDEIERLLEGNRSLRQGIGGAIAQLGSKTARRVALDLRERKEITAAVMAKLDEAALTEEQVLGDWFPADPDGG
jgi:Domain of unknown function DUF29